MAWSKREDAILRQMWMSPQRYSAGEIARRLEGRSRSAVIGRIHRRIRAGENELQRMDRQNLTRVRSAKGRSPHRTRPHSGKDTAELELREGHNNRNPAARDGRQNAYDSSAPGLLLTALEQRQCRFPLNDPDPDAVPGMREEFRFCGKRARPDSSYCEHHHRRCHAQKIDVEAEFFAKPPPVRRCSGDGSRTKVPS